MEYEIVVLRPVPKAHLALLATNLLFAVNYTSVKYLLSGGFIAPFALNLARVGVAALLFWLISAGRRSTPIAPPDRRRFFFAAFTGIALNQMLFIKGLSFTTSIHASLLMLITPIAITVFAAIVLREKLTVNKSIGLVLGITGATVLILAKEKTGSPPHALLGDSMIILNAFAYAVYFVLVKPLMQRYPAVQVLRVCFTIGFFLMLPFCAPEFSRTAWGNFNHAAWGALLLVVVGGTFLAYLWNIYGLKILGASTAGAYIYLQPLFAAAIAIGVLGESLTAVKIIAGLCIMAGVFLANKLKIADGNSGSNNGL